MGHILLEKRSGLKKLNVNRNNSYFDFVFYIYKKFMKLPASYWEMSTDDNIIVLPKNILRKLRFRHPCGYIAGNIFLHTEHPSLLSVPDTLAKFEVRTLSQNSRLNEVRVTSDSMSCLKCPLLEQCNNCFKFLNVQ